MDLAIIGGGIGGLTTAIALRRKGINSTVFEASKALQPVGAGIILASNATQVYQRLGLLPALQAAGQHLVELRLTDEQLRPLSCSDLRYFERRTGAGSLAIHRAELQRILLEHLPAEQVQLNQRITRLESAPTPQEGAILHFADGSQRTFTAVIAADGLHSVGRSWVAPDSQLRQANQICWRGIADDNLSDEPVPCLQEAWGRGQRFGFTPIAPGKVYWYALADGEQPTPLSTAELQANFRAFAPVVGRLLANTPPERIISHAIQDFPPLAAWARGPVCLLGDAAHATTPNLGQGACQAVVDAYTLAELLARQTDVPVAFEQFYATRRATTAYVTDTSWRVGKLAHLRNAVGCRLRNTLMRMTPAKLNRQQNEKLFRLEIDALPQ